MKQGFTLLLLLCLSLLALPALADETVGCPPGVTDGHLDTEFGPGATALTRCIKKRDEVKVVVQINKFCRDDVPNAQCGANRGYTLNNIANMIDDYENNYGMQRGKDYKIVAVTYAGGSHMLIQDRYSKTGGNPLEPAVRDLMAKGVTFYFCQNTARNFIKRGFLDAGEVTNVIIPGVQFTTAGVTGIADFEALGYRYLAP